MTAVVKCFIMYLTVSSDTNQLQKIEVSLHFLFLLRLDTIIRVLISPHLIQVVRDIFTHFIIAKKLHSCSRISILAIKHIY